MSSKLMTQLSTCPVDLSTTVGIRPVCIDNEDIRSQILKDKKIEIISVPCVLVAYNTGNVEKYEGSNAFQWIEETVSKYMPQQHQQPQPQPQPQHQQPQYQQHDQTQQQHQYQQHEQPQQPQQQPQHQPQKQIHHSDDQKIKKKVIKKETTMEDLGIVSEETEEIVRQPVGVRNGPGSYDMSIEFGEEQEQNRIISKQLKSSTQAGTGKAKDLMATAMAMQKERDSPESNKSITNE